MSPRLLLTGRFPVVNNNSGFHQLMLGHCMQSLIYAGQVMDNDKYLSDYGVPLVRPQSV